MDVPVRTLFAPKRVCPMASTSKFGRFEAFVPDRDKSICFP